MNNPINNPMNNQVNSQMNNQNFPNYSQMNNFNQPNQYQNFTPQIGVQTPFYSHPFSSPIGVVFQINSKQDLNSIPIGAGTNFYWCAQENKLYLRNLNNGLPEIKEFTILNNTEQDIKMNNSKNNYNELEQKVQNLEKQIKELIKNNSQKGGTSEWQL